MWKYCTHVVTYRNLPTYVLLKQLFLMKCLFLRPGSKVFYEPKFSSILPNWKQVN